MKTGKTTDRKESKGGFKTMAGGIDTVELSAKNSLSWYKVKIAKKSANENLSTDLRYYLMRWKEM
jgi:hypothetical protein